MFPTEFRRFYREMCFLTCERCLFRCGKKLFRSVSRLRECVGGDLESGEIATGALASSEPRRGATQVHSAGLCSHREPLLLCLTARRRPHRAIPMPFAACLEELLLPYALGLSETERAGLQIWHEGTGMLAELPTKSTMGAGAGANAARPIDF